MGRATVLQGKFRKKQYNWRRKKKTDKYLSTEASLSMNVTYKIIKLLQLASSTTTVQNVSLDTISGAMFNKQTSKLSPMTKWALLFALITALPSPLQQGRTLLAQLSSPSARERLLLPPPLPCRIRVPYTPRNCRIIPSLLLTSRVVSPATEKPPSSSSAAA